MPSRARIVIGSACAIALIGIGARAAFGLFLEPMSLTRGWPRETFALAMAWQNLLWGIGTPIAGAIADRAGARSVMITGALLYAAGMLGMVAADSAMMLYLCCGILAGCGVALTSFSIALAAIVRVVAPHQRALALGLGTAAGSFGQVLFSPVTQITITAYGWPVALMAVAGSVLPFPAL